MSDDRKIGGYAIFFLVVLIAAAAAAFAFGSTGTMGIEERFRESVGLSGDGENGGGAAVIDNGSMSETGPSEKEPDDGFSLEGNLVLYLAFLLLLAAVSVVMYRKFRV